MYFHPLRYYLFSLLFYLMVPPLFAQSVVTIPDSLAHLKTYHGGNFFSLNKQLLILRDKSQKLTYQQVKKSNVKFVPNNTNQVPLTHFENCWVKITLKSPVAQNYLLYFPSTFDIDVYLERKNHDILLLKTGHSLAPSQKSMPNYRKHFIKIPLGAHEPATLYILYKGNYRSFFNAEVLLSLYPAKAYESSTYVANIVKSNEVFIYIWLVLMVYNWLLFLIVKEWLYFTYVFYIFTWLGFSDATFHMLSFVFAKASLVHLWQLFAFLYCVCFVTFLQKYLQVKVHLPRFARVNRFILFFSGWIILYAFIDLLLVHEVIPPSAFSKALYSYTIQAVSIFILISALIPLLFFYQAIVIYRKGYKPASWYIAGSFVLLFSISGFYLLNYITQLSHIDGLLNDVLQIGQQIGFTVEMIIFSVGIGYRYNSTQKTKQQLLKNQNKFLEQQIGLHTNQLVEANEEITRQRDRLEQKNNDIMDSIKYAQYIQQAFLPPKEEIQALFPESFIFFKPKDVVSGDFYWFSQISRKAQQVRDKMYESVDSSSTYLNDDSTRVVVAAADCTGHGVAGALMSMVGNNALNKIVLERGIVEADKILNLLHLNVLQLVYNQDARSGVGMDISLLVIDTKAKTMEFAAGASSIVVFQKNELNSLRSDIFSVGGEGGIGRKFKKQVIDISIPTTIYMYSDGYRDQFGGEEGKKFSTRRFYQLLRDVQAYPMQKQEEIITATMHEWMGNSKEEQLDDMLVMGIKIGGE